MFLRSPAGVAIRTDQWTGGSAEAARVLLEDDIVVVTNERGHELIVPTDNVASIEIQAGPRV